MRCEICELPHLVATFPTPGHALAHLVSGFTKEFPQQLPACGSLGIKQQQILLWNKFLPLQSNTFSDSSTVGLAISLR